MKAVTDTGVGDHLVGHVVHADQNSIVGWLANMTRPHKLETVTVTDEYGRSFEWRALHFRHDVCGWFGVQGRFGFVIPTTGFQSLGGTVSLRDSQGAILPGGEAIRVERAPAAETPMTTVFLHIPKTAGTSLRNAMTAGLTPSERIFVYPSPYGLSVREFAGLPIGQRRAARLLAGHTYFGIDGLLGKPARYVTFLREPLARLRSHVHHHVRAGTVFDRHGIPLDLAMVVEEGLNEEFDNLMVRMLAGLPGTIVPAGEIGEKDLELAIYNVSQRFDMVGFAETLDADAARLARLLGRPIGPIGRENVAEKGTPPVQGGRSIDWNRVNERNRFDRLLYERLRLFTRAGNREAAPAAGRVRRGDRARASCRG
jgi:hypothetical protein